MTGASSETPGNLRDRVVGYRADRALAPERVGARVSAYVYGNIIVFASVVPLSRGAVEEGHALLVVAGAALSTFLAHVFAELVGHGAAGGERAQKAVLHEVRDAGPIASSALVPVLVLAAAWAGWLSASAAVIAADVYLMARIALIGLTAERLRSTRASLGTLLSGLALAGVAALIGLIKVFLGH